MRLEYQDDKKSKHIISQLITKKELDGKILNILQLMVVSRLCEKE